MQFKNIALLVPFLLTALAAPIETQSIEARDQDAAKFYDRSENAAVEFLRAAAADEDAAKYYDRRDQDAAKFYDRRDQDAAKFYDRRDQDAAKFYDRSADQDAAKFYDRRDQDAAKFYDRRDQDAAKFYDRSADQDAAKFYDRRDQDAAKFYDRRDQDAAKFYDRSADQDAAKFYDRRDQDAAKFYDRRDQDAAKFYDRRDQDAAKQSNRWAMMLTTREHHLSIAWPLRLATMRKELEDMDQGQASLPHEANSPPPDGGHRAWLQILAGHLINALTWGYSASFGVYQLYYTTTLKLPPSQVSWIGSIQIFLTFFVGTFSGRSADAGYAQHTALLGSVMLVLGTFMTSLATRYWQIFLAQGLCTGIGMGVLYMPAVAVIGTYFAKNKAMALGMAASGSGTGSIIFPLVVQHLQPQVGFRRAVQVQGYIALAFAIIINLLLRPRLPPRKSGPLVEWPAFLEPAYSLFTVGMFLIFWALYFCFFYVNTYATSIIGLSDISAVNLLIVISAVGIPVRPLLGLAADRYFGALPTLVVSSTALGAMLYVWMAIRSVAGMYVWAVIYGLATGATQGIFVGGLASLTTDLSKMGTRFGMVCSVLAFASLAGPPTAGALIQSQNGSFTAAQIWGGTVTIAGALFIAAAKWSQLLLDGRSLTRIRIRRSPTAQQVETECAEQPSSNA
ncbi:hypothetical protein VTN77DRAFT_6801 [Rasamsonia byssochlamydoides]|uniref:uncharacterized protein n=1 Tax=Rasamsonia byssochlamydoides TaxID=89139 RepID=UPI0037421168